MSFVTMWGGMDGRMCAVCVNKRTDKHLQLLSFIFLLDISSVLLYTKTLHRAEERKKMSIKVWTFVAYKYVKLLMKVNEGHSLSPQYVIVTKKRQYFLRRTMLLKCLSLLQTFTHKNFSKHFHYAVSLLMCILLL